MKKITFFLFLFVSVLTNAQKFSVLGKIVNKNQEALPGATILVKETNQGTSSDLNGAFKLNLENGTYTIRISYVGFKTVEKNIRLDEDKTLTIVLSADENVLDEVLVSAVRATADIPVTYSNLG